MQTTTGSVYLSEVNAPLRYFHQPVNIASFEASSVRLVSGHRYSAMAAWPLLARQNGSLPRRR
jgi:hypothetical protein